MGGKRAYTQGCREDIYLRVVYIPGVKGGRTTLRRGLSHRGFNGERPSG